MTSLERAARWAKYAVGLQDNSWIVARLRPAYNMLLDLRYFGSGIPRQFAGEERLRIRPRFRDYKDDFEPQTFSCLRKLLHEGSIVIEAGANMGAVTMIMARWVGATGKIYAFEPAPDSYAALQDHLKLNDLSERVVALPMAVSDTTGTSSFYADGDSGQNTLAVRHDGIPSAVAIQVDLTTIDAFCEDRKIVPHLLKVDVEGYELHALRGASNTLARHKPLVLIEFHPMNWPAIGVTAEDFRVFLKGVGYRIVPISPVRDPLTDYSHALLEFSDLQ